MFTGSKIRILSFCESPMPKQLQRYWALVPAAGVGRRLSAGVPKQYLSMGQRTMLERSVSAMLVAPWIHRLLVVCSETDDQAEALLAALPRVSVARCGGPTRRDSVLAGLRHLIQEEAALGDDWVLVHDAARPGLQAADLERLRAATEPEAGEPPADCALLAVRVADTVKLAHGDSRDVERTIDRSRLWLAQTPQVCRIGRLIAALEQCPEATDEASAVEFAGGRVRLIEGSAENFKVTTADDLARMRWTLEQRS